MGAPDKAAVEFCPSGSAGPATGDWLSGRAPRSHRGGHWFDPSIAHPAQRPVAIMQLAVFDLGDQVEELSRAPAQDQGRAAVVLPACDVGTAVDADLAGG